MKKLLTFLLCFVFLLGAFGLVACDNSTATVSQKTKQNADELFSVQGVSAPVFGATIKRFSAGDNGGQVSVSKRISATVTPASALNKKVDYRVFWVGEAERGDEPVSDYIVVTPDSDGSANATVTCYQSFGDDVICVQVVTRDGGYTAECVVTYVGFLTEMSVTSSAVSLSNTQERGDYYELYTNNTYTFTVDMDNDLHDVKNYDLSVTTGGVGEFWFYGTLTYDKRQVEGGFMPRYVEGWFVNPAFDPNNEYFRKYCLNDIVNNFITATVNDNVVTIEVKGKELYNYCIDHGDELYKTDIYCNATVYEDNYITGFNENFGAQNVSDNAANLPSAYFTVTVTDANTNIASTVKLWVVSSVNGVSLSVGNLEF